MIGYKATDMNGCCRGFKFEVGKTYTKDTPKEELKCCTDKVFHFCRELFAIEKESQYKLSESRIFEVIAGDYNSGSYNSGYFNSNEPFVRMFNKDTKLKRDEINIPSFCYFDLTVWVSHDTATEEEKKEYKIEIETCGGFSKTLNYKEAWRLAWDKASKEEHLKMLKLPNWDNEVFKEISGIDAEAEIAEEK